MATTSWLEKATAKQKSSLEKIPKEWLLPTSITETLQTPLESNPDRLIQMDIPRKSGIMSERELDITENYTVSALLQALRAGQMTALEVTVAFSKRAAIAQQLVRDCQLPYNPLPYAPLVREDSTDKSSIDLMSYRNILHRGPRTRSLSRLRLRRRPYRWAPSRTAHQSERQLSNHRLSGLYWICVVS
jgi:hypothetical protein